MTIHRVLNASVPELNRVLELIQKQTTTQAVQNVVSSTPSGGAGVSSSGSVGPQGPTGPTGPAGADGIANLDLFLVSLTEREVLVVDNNGDVVYDEYGMAVRDVHTDWDIVTDELGNIITAE